MILVGGVAQLYQGDLDLGRRAIDLLAREDLGPDVLVEDLSYGAVAVAQRLDELRPEALVLVGSETRGREPGTVEAFPVSAPPLPPAEVRLAVAEAVTGYVAIDLVLEVAGGLDVLPARTVVVEVEPARTDPAPDLSPEVEAALPQALALVRGEVSGARAGR